MKEVGVRIKVGATGLEQVEKLSAELNATGVSTTELDSKLSGLSDELKRLAKRQDLIDSFKRQKQAVSDAAAAMEEAKERASALGREISATEAPTKKQEAAFTKARQAARDASEAYTSQRLELQTLRTSMTAAGVGTDGLAKNQVKLRADMAQAQAAVKGLEGEYRALGEAATRSATTQTAAVKETGASLDMLAGKLRTLVAGGVAGIVGAQTVQMAKSASETADAYTNLAARIRLVTGEGPAFDAAFKGVFAVATRTSSAVEATGQLFTKLAQAGKALGVSQAEALALTETINQAVQLGGASAASSEAAITQLVQGLQSGVLRGDEFNSVMEQAPRLAQALADGLGVATGELRKMAEAGQLSADVVVQALRGQASTLSSEFSKLPQTVGRALQNLSTEWTRYVGEVDKANGISNAAASAINALASNLDTLGALLATAGKAAAAYAALRLGQMFRDKAAAVAASAAAIGTETAAVAGNTAATTANTAAKVANVAAARTAAGAAGLAATAATAAAGAVTATGAAAAGAAAGGLTALRVAGLRILGLLGPIGAAIAVVSLGWDGIKAAGTWLGETAAKLTGARDGTEELAAATRASAAAAKADSEARAKLAQETALAVDKALGLTAASRKLVGDFDEMRTKGDSASEALGKLAKNLDLGSPEGIRDAIGALDALAVKGKVSGAEVRNALRQALDGKDLGIFEVQARAAFDGTAQGARRLGLALEGIATESLARVGTSVRELETGFSQTFLKANNDTDALAATLKNMGTAAAAAGPLLAKSIDKEIEAATTEKALRRVEERLQAMGATGQLSGEQVAAGLEKARKKADEILPGISSVAEAATKLGVKTRDELQRTATEFKASWDVIANSTKVTLQDKISAFGRYREAAIAANGGVESSEVALQRQTLETQARVSGLGDAFERAMSKSRAEVDKTNKLVNELGQEINAAGELLNQAAMGFGKVTAAAKQAEDAALRYGSALKSAQYDGDKFALGSDGQRFTAGGQLKPPDSSGDWEFVGDVRANNLNVPGGAVAVMGQGYWKRKGGSSSDASLGASGTASVPGASNGGAGAPLLGSQPEAPAAPASSAVETGSMRRVEVNLQLNGRGSTTVGVASDADAERLASFLRQLELEAGRSA